MRPPTRLRREQVRHADDWLMTYADTITLLLCFFAIFLTVSVAKKQVPQPPRAAAPVALPAPHKDVIEGDLPFHGLVRADHPTAAAATPTEKPPAPPRSAPVRMEVTRNPVPPPPTAAKPQPPKPAPPAPPGDRITILDMGSAAFFASGSATLSAPGEAILRGVAQKLAADAYKGYEITVEGHTDDTPIHTVQFPSNWELSTARAAAVVHFLLDQGIPAQRLRAAGYADTFPKVPNRDANGNPIPANQARNRRVVIKLEKIEPAQSGATAAEPPHRP
jgi:chemotaxis protein MotB